jgi:hypothetical protein
MGTQGLSSFGDEFPHFGRQLQVLRPHSRWTSSCHHGASPAIDPEFPFWPPGLDSIQQSPRFMPWSLEGPVELKVEFKDKAKSPDRVYRGTAVLEAFEACYPE